MNDSIPDNERDWSEISTPTMTFTLMDSAHVPITLANITSFLLYQWIPQGPWKPVKTINSRNGQNVLNANGVTIDATSGVVTWLMTTADTTMQSNDLAVTEEKHYFRFDLIYTSTAGPISGSGPGSFGSDYYIVHRKQILPS